MGNVNVSMQPHLRQGLGVLLFCFLVFFWFFFESNTLVFFGHHPLSRAAYAGSSVEQIGGLDRFP